ncbi:sarcosine oxidase subunit gamma [Jannaschia sp. 2305UL9-9]|uniref:sarcosine oxidase subunit gamma n=1 Tax=Jannaschia sp. 2305UL9-9 TaxID=3121638 RepID=UPI003528C379
MANLTARSPAEGLLPISHGTLTLTEIRPDAITSLMLLRGAEGTLPKPNRALRTMGGVLLWSGRNQALLLGPRPDPQSAVAMTDQSDAWAVLHLAGPQSAEGLARLTPLDLNPAIFRPGHVARSLLSHMNAVFHRTALDGFDILVFRSMTGTAVHDITRAMRAVTARADL